MKIAIVGSGIAGLTAAHYLHRTHDVTVFEAAEHVGGHTHTIDVAHEGERHAVDTGFIVYNETTYPHFTRLLAELGVETQPSEMSFSVSCEQSGLEWASHSTNALFAQRRNLLRPDHYRLLREILRFNRESRRLLEQPEEKVVLGDYLCGAGYSAGFVKHYVIPIGAAIWSADPQAFLQMPAATFVRFFRNHGLLERNAPVQWRVVRSGSARYVERLTAPFRERIRTGSPVRAIRRQRRFVEVAVAGEVQEFDHVVLALHSDQALRVLVDPSGLERWALGRIAYQANDVVLHTDATLLPAQRRAWASWNYRIPADRQHSALVTYDMNRLQGIASDHRFLVTLNAGNRIDPARVLGRWVYDHPVFDAGAIEAQRCWPELTGQRRTHYCGAYWGYGFHEDGVRSALRVCRDLGVEA